jgi:general secretion pathway protein H
MVRRESVAWSQESGVRRRRCFFCRLDISLRIKHHSGFTLLEILVVLILVALASSLAYVSVGRDAHRRQERTFARQLAALCQSARQRAIATGRVVTVRIEPDTRRCRIDESTEALEIPKRLGIEGDGILVNEQGWHIIRFFPDGSSSGGVLSVTRPEAAALEFRIDQLTGLVMPVKARS